MDDYKEHWRLRLVELFEGTRLSQSQFAGLVDVSPDYLSRLFYKPGKKGRKNVGPAIAHKVIEAFDLPPGWFDLPLGQALPRSPSAASEADTPKAEEPKQSAVPSINQGQLDWPFKIVTYQRIDRVRRHFAPRGMPSAISDIDKHLDVLVTRWEVEMARPKRAND